MKNKLKMNCSECVNRPKHLTSKQLEEMDCRECINSKPKSKKISDTIIEKI